MHSIQTIDKRIRAGLLLFWALYFTTVLVSNSADALKALSLLPTGWAFASTNYELVRTVVGIYNSPVWLGGLLFAGVISWQGLSAFLFWGAFLGAIRQTETNQVRIHQAFGVSIGLWAAFILSDELFLAYELGGLTSTHFNLLISELATFILLRSRD